MTALVHDVPLIGNGFALSSSPDRLGRLVPTDPARPRASIAARLVHGSSGKGCAPFSHRARFASVTGSCAQTKTGVLPTRSAWTAPAHVPPAAMRALTTSA
jgi:hypothetical protein